MTPKVFRQQLVSSDQFAQYSLRSTFFARRLRGMRLWDAIHEVNKLVTMEDHFDWADREAFGIGMEAWQRIKDKSTPYTPDEYTRLIDQISEVRVVRMRDGFHLIFSSEPDISLRNKADLPIMAIEVKAGSDPAGALERLGAAMKSFDNDRNLNPRLKTVYIVRCITPELQKRISHNNPFDHTFSLGELLSDRKTQLTLANLVRRVILGKR